MKAHLALASALALLASIGTATANGANLSGNYLVKLSHDVFFTTQGYTGHGPNTTHCLTLQDNGATGWPHSGYALLDNNFNNSGQFAVIGDTIVIYIYALGSGQEPADFVFTTTAVNGDIARKGAFDYIQGGTSYDADVATFGAKGSC